LGARLQRITDPVDFHFKAIDDEEDLGHQFPVEQEIRKDFRNTRKKIRKNLSKVDGVRIHCREELDMSMRPKPCSRLTPVVPPMGEP